MNVHSSLIPNSPKLETAQMPISRYMGKHPYSGILLDNKKDHKKPSNTNLKMIMLRENTWTSPPHPPPKVHLYKMLKNTV